MVYKEELDFIFRNVHVKKIKLFMRGLLKRVSDMVKSEVNRYTFTSAEVYGPCSVLQ